MRILYLYPFGGINPKHSKFVMGQGILHELIKRGHSVFVVPSSSQELSLAKTLEVSVFAPNRENVLNKALERILLVKNITKRLRQLSALVTTNRIDVILERHKLVNEGLEVSKITNVPYVTNDVMSYPDIDYYGTRLLRILKALFPSEYFAALERRPFLGAQSIISHSLAYSEILKNEYDVEPDRVFQFYAMVDQNLFVPADRKDVCAELGLNPHTFNIVYAGSFDRLHTAGLLMPVIHRLAELDVLFLLVGDGPMLEPMKEAIIQSGLESKVVFAGRVARDRVVKYIQAAHIGVESIWNERVRKYGADAIKIAEYMACGKPVIASDLPGQVQEVCKRDAGILVDPSDSRMFAKAIKGLYDNRLRCKEMGRQARNLIEGRWNWNFTGDIIEKALRFAVGSSRKEL